MILRKEINIKWSSVKLSFYLNYIEEFKIFVKKIEFCKLKIQTGAVFIFEYDFLRGKGCLKQFTSYLNLLNQIQSGAL